MTEVGALAAVSTKPKKDTHPLHRFGQPDSKPFFDHARIKAHFVLELMVKFNHAHETRKVCKHDQHGTWQIVAFRGIPLWDLLFGLLPLICKEGPRTRKVLADVYERMELRIAKSNGC